MHSYTVSVRGAGVPVKSRNDQSIEVVGRSVAGPSAEFARRTSEAQTGDRRISRICRSRIRGGILARQTGRSVRRLLMTDWRQKTAGLMERYRSGQPGQTVNLLAFAYGGSNPPLSTIRHARLGGQRGVTGKRRRKIETEIPIGRCCWSSGNRNHHRGVAGRCPTAFRC